MSFYPRFMLIGGLAQSLVNFREPLLRGLRDAGCEVHAAAAAVHDNDSVVARLDSIGVHPHSVPISRAGLNPVSDLRALVALVRLMHHTRPDLVLGYTIKPVVWGTLAAWVAGVPRRYAMITGLGYAFTGKATRMRARVQRVVKILYRFALSRTHGIFFQNPDDLALFRELGLIPDRIPTMVVNGSGVDLDSYPMHPLPEGPLRFLMIARLLGDKGVREYAAAAAIVRQTHPGAAFHLVGGLDPNPDAISREEVENWTARGDIVWHGEQADVRPYLAEAHVFVLPSYREGTPRTVLEAMATGRPIITTDAPGCRETVVDGHNGLLIPARNGDALADAMLRFLSCPEMIDGMAKRSLDIVREKYCSEKVTASMLEAMNIPGKIAR